MTEKKINAWAQGEVGTTYIYYELSGKEERWGVTADPDQDTTITLKDHLEKYIPEAKFIRAEYHDEEGFVFEYI